MKKTTFRAAVALAAGALALTALPAKAKIGSCTTPIMLGTTISETGPFSTLADRWRKMTEVFAEEFNKARRRDRQVLQQEAADQSS